MAQSTRNWHVWLERRRRVVFGWLLLLAFLVQNLGIWVAWQAGSPLQTLLNVLGGGCTLYLLLSNVRGVLSMSMAYRVGAAFLTLRLAVELVHNLATGHVMTTAQYQEATLLMAFMVTLMPQRASATVSITILTLVLILTVQHDLKQIIEFLILLVTAGVLHFTAEYGRQAVNARNRVQELERQLVWDPLTGVAHRQIVQERLRTYMLNPANQHLIVTLTLSEGTCSEGRHALQLVVKTLKPLLSDADTLGRWSDDTLLLVFPHVAAGQRAAVTGAVSRALGELIGQGLLLPGLRVGSAVLSEGSTPEQVVQRATEQGQPIAV